MTVVLFTMGFLIKEAYCIHDEVTGSMILQETLQNARHNQDESTKSGEFVSEGLERGNPRMWLGAYRLSLDEGKEQIRGSAGAGDWGAEIEMKQFKPEQYLRIFQALTGIKDGEDDGGD